MKDKKPIKLISWQKYIVIGLAICGGITLSFYRSYSRKGQIDKIDIASMVIALLLCFGVLWGMASWGNRPEKDE